MKRAPRMEIMWRGQLGNENDGPAVERSGAPDDERNQHRGRLEYDHGFNEVNRGMIMVSGGILGSKSEPLGGPSTTELLARRLLRELYVESRRPQTT